MLSVKTEAEWNEVYEIRACVGGVWRIAQDVWVRKDGRWENVSPYVFRWENALVYFQINQNRCPGLRSGSLKYPDGSPMAELPSSYYLYGFTYSSYEGHSFISSDDGRDFSVFLNGLRDFRWQDGPWFEFVGKTRTETYTGYGIRRDYRSISSAAVTALEVYLRQNIGKSVTLYFR